MEGQQRIGDDWNWEKLIKKRINSANHVKAAETGRTKNVLQYLVSTISINIELINQEVIYIL